MLKAVQVRDARPHDARHTAATLLLAQGVDQRVVMEILGHPEISMTSRYTHVLPQMMTAAAEGMGEALWARHEANCNHNCNRTWKRQHLALTLAQVELVGRVGLEPTTGG